MTWTLRQMEDDGQWELMDDTLVYGRYLTRVDALADAEAVADQNEAMAATLHEEADDAQDTADECRALLKQEGA